MKDIYKTKKQLIKELEDARREISRVNAGKDSAGSKSRMTGQVLNYQGNEEVLTLVSKAINSTTDAIGLSDPEGRHVYQNRAFSNMFEYTGDELEAAGGVPAIFAVGRIAREVFGSIMSGRSWAGEVEVRAKSGREFGVHLRADAIKDDQGRIVGLVQVFTDITERKLIEYQLKRKHDELQLILDSIPAYVFYKDRAGKMLNINKAATALAYVPKEKLLNKTVFDLVPETADKYNRDDMEVITSGQPKTNIEEPLHLPDGVRWLKTDKLPIKDDAGNIIGLLGFSVDITDRKRSQEELAQSEALLGSFFNSPGLLCGVVEIEGDDVRYIRVNAAMAAMYGLRPEDVSNRLSREIGTDKEIVKLFIDNYKRSEQENSPAYFEYQRGSGSGMRWLSVMVTFLGIESTGSRSRFAFVTTDITARKAAEEALRESEQKLRVMFESMTDAVVLADLNAKVLDINSSAVGMFGYSREEAIGCNGLDLLAFEHREEAVEKLAAYVAGKEITGPQEFRIISKDGRAVDSEIVVNRLIDRTGKPYGFVVVVRDITAKKAAEAALKESERKMRSLFDVSPDVIMNVDRQGRILFINRAMTRAIEETIGTPVFDYIPLEYHSAYAETIERVFRTGEPETIETRGLGPEKRISWYEARFVALESENEQRTLMVAATDITARRQAEEELRESETKYRYLAEKMTDIVWMLDMDLNTTYASPSITRILGYTPEERLVQPVQDQLTQESYKRVLKTLAVELERDGREGVDPDRSVTIEVEYYRKDGSTVWMENVVSAIRDEKGKPVMLHGVSRNIAERKRAEGALQESEQKLRWMFESIKEGIFIVGMDGRVLEANAGVEKITGYSRKQLLGQSGLDYIFPGFKGDAMGTLGKMIERGGTHREVIVPMKTAAGDTIEVEASSSTLRDSSGNPVGLIGIFRDVSERKRMENALRDSEEKLRLTFASMADGIVVTDIEGHITDINEAQMRMFGFKEKSELIGRGGFDFLSERERGRALADMFKVYEEGFNTGSTYTVVDRNGREFECELSTALLRDAAGKPSGTVTVMRDVTERRRMEQTLRESEERYRLLAENSLDAIWTIDMGLKYTFISPAILRIVKGYTLEELQQMSIQELLTPESFSRAVKLVEEELVLERTGGSDPFRSRTVELALKNKDGSAVWTEITASFIRDSEGKVIGVQGSTRDITERRKAEQLIRESEERYRLLAENVSDVIWTMDLNLRFTYMSPSVLNIRGYTAEEALVMPLEKTVAPGSMKTILQVIKEEFEIDHTEQYASRTIEVELKCKDGATVWTEMKISWLHDAGGNRIGIMGVTRDISERRKVQEALRETSEKLRVIFDSIGEAVTVVDMNGDIVDANREVLRLHGFNRKEEIIGRKSSELVAVVDRERAVSDAIKSLKAPNLSGSNEYKLVDVTGREFDGEFNIAVMRGEEEKPVGFIGIARDISERKKMETALRESEEKLRVTFDSMMDSVVVSDPNLSIVDVNKAALEVLGVKTKEELMGRNAAEVIRFKDREAALSNLSRMLMERHPQIRVEYGIVLPDGRDMDVEVSTAMMHDDAGSVVGFVNVIRDVSERKKWEGALRQSEEKYRNLVEREKDVIVSVDALGFVKTVNSAVNTWGYTVDEVLKMNFLELVAPEWREVTATELQTRLLESGEYVGETVVTRKDGEERPIEYTAVVIQEGGKYAGAQAIVRDISERKKAEEALEAKERYFRAITDLSSGAALVVNLEGVIVDVTGGLERISGHTRESTIGRLAIDFIHPEDLKNAGAYFDECLHNPGKTVAFEARLRNASGEWQWTESMITNLLDHSDVRGIVNHLVDITGRKKTEEEIKNHAKRVEVLYSVVQVISHSETLDKMLKDSLDKVCSAMNTESGCIFMLDLDENSLKLRASKGVPESTKQEFSSIVLTEQGIEKIMQVQGPVTEVDEENTVADIEGTKKVTAELERKSLAATPLFRGNELQGFLVVFSSKERRFSSEDLELFKATANEISLGIENLTLLEQTREMSMTDELTGLYNRRYFFEMLDVEINRSGRTGRPFSVVMIDLDGFKEYNDKYGHSNGDAVLEEFGHVMMASIRKSDLAFRYGGDEFAMILSGADSERARKIVQRTRAKWEKVPLKQPGAAGGQVGFSSGIAEYPSNAESSDGLIFLADAALYQAKRKGYEDKLVSELRTLSTNIIDVATQDQVYALAATVDARDPYTYGHSQRVAETALRIGRAIGLSSEDLAKLHAAALLHDIGKVGVPDAILTKPGKPSPEEWDLIKKHCAEGARIVGYVKEMSTLVPIVLHHHEWYDGSGYPAGLKGLEIPPGARITSVADAYDTMVTKRPYRDAITPREACEELKRSAGTQFDPVIVDVWCKLVEKEK